MFFSFSWLCSVTSSSSWAYIHRPVGSIFWVVRLLAKAVWVAAICPRKAQKIFYFSVVWIGSRSTFVLCTALPRPYLAMGQGGQLPPRLGNWLQSIIKYSLFVAASYWAIMDLPAPLSCFSRGFARPTSILANSVICACANLCGAKKTWSSHGRTGRSGCYGPDTVHKYMPSNLTSNRYMYMYTHCCGQFLLKILPSRPLRSLPYVTTCKYYVGLRIWNRIVC